MGRHHQADYPLRHQSGPSRQPADDAVDVCLVVEGCYPYRRGGVSNWVDTLLRDQAALSFAVISIQPPGIELPPLYSLPSNVRTFHRLRLGPTAQAWRRMHRLADDPLDELVDALADFVRTGKLRTLARIIQLARKVATRNAIALTDLVDNKLGWDIACRMYRKTAPKVSFREYYWAWRALFGGLLAVIACPLPRATVFHSVSTGFAGLLVARAAHETGRPALLTEHGIYANERLIELLMADWISDDIDLSLSVYDQRVSLRSFWIGCFESYARTCYEASGAIITLFSDNQAFQRELGAEPAKLRVIANGVDSDTFARLPRAPADGAPTVALIGRVVPVKDVKTFLLSVRLARSRLPALTALVVGDLEEDASYAAQCKALAHELGLGDCVQFTGAVDVTQILPRLHVMVLTSLTEAQPLAILEAGATGVPCIATDVGGCREIVLGTAAREDDAEPGGIVTRPLAPAETAEAMVTLLSDHGLRRRCGDALQARVRRFYDKAKFCRAYSALYGEFRQAPTVGMTMDA
jgi:polysaccharide biosynthesis protein PelF